MRASRLRRVVLAGGLASVIVLLTLALTPLSGHATPIDYRAEFLPGFVTPSCVAAGDFNADGFEDLVVTEFNANRVMMYAGDGKGTFAARAALSGFNGPWAVCARDMNSDGRPDLVIANYSGNFVTSILLNQNWSVLARSDGSSGGNGPFAIAAFRNVPDALPAVGVTNFLAGTWSLVFGDEDGLAKNAEPIATGSQPSAIAVGDLNGDGREDVAVTNYGSNTVSVYLAYANLAFLPRVDYPTTGKPLGVAIGDLDEDGRPDLAVTNSTTASVSVFRGTATGTFGARSDIAVGAGPRAIALRDLDRDGHLEMIVVNQMDGRVMILPGIGLGSFGPTQILTVGTDPRTLAIGDFDDPHSALDLAVSNFGSGTISLEFARRTATEIVFDATPSTTDPAQPVQLEATVVPTDVNGEVRFLDGETMLGSVPVVAGHASLTVVDLAPGSHSLTASFAGDSLHYPSMSTIVPHLVRYPSVTRLTSSLPSAPVGAPVTFTAFVTTEVGTPTGEIRFVLDGTSLDPTVALADGRASVTLADLALGTHSVEARYLGDPAHAPSSDTLDGGQAVRRLVVVQLEVAPEPSAIWDTVTCVASLTPTDATGVIEFLDAGTPLGSAPLVSGTARLGVVALGLGTHRLTARYPGDAGTAPAESDTVLHEVVELPPTIAGVRDVPSDQGGHVTLTWRHRLDRPGVRVVTGYRIWRRVPAPTAVRADMRALRVLRPAGAQETFWEAIADLPAAQRVSYGYTAATTQDSMVGDNPYTAFLVQALTADPFVFFDSAPDSGYSVDNLAPAMPTPFAVTYGTGQNRLHWTPSTAPDLQAYHVHRGLSALFVPSTANRIATTLDTTLSDAPGDVYYKLIAVDVHGNRSLAATASPLDPVGVLASLAALETAPDRIRITWYAPGLAGGPVTVQRRSPTTGWANVAVLVPDGSGYLPYVDTDVVAGGRYGYRLELVDGGVAVTAAEVWAVADRLEFALESPRPNPSTDGRLTLAFSLPSSAPARLDLLDVAGRRVASREVGGLGAGRHTLTLGNESRMAPGLYLVRLSQGSEVRVGRVIVID